MFRPSARRLAQHLPGTRGLKFPDRKAKRQSREGSSARRPATTTLHQQPASNDHADVGLVALAAQHHDLAPHPCAPQSVIDRFPEWMKAKQADSGSFSSYGSSGDKSTGGRTSSPSSSSSSGSASSSAGQGSSSSGSGYSGALLEEWDLPAHLARTRYAPTEAECEAIDVSDTPLACENQANQLARAADQGEEADVRLLWASQSGGATVSPEISKGTWEKWHLAQI